MTVQTVIESLNRLQAKISSPDVGLLGDGADGVKAADVISVLKVAQDTNATCDGAACEKLGFSMWNCAVTVFNASLRSEDTDLNRAGE